MVLKATNILKLITVMFNLIPWDTINNLMEIKNKTINPNKSQFIL